MPQKKPTAQDIKRIVSAIRDAVNLGVEEHRIRYNFRDFHKSMPHLFDAALNPAFELKYLDMMLDQMQAATKQGGTEAAFEKADESVIGKLREEYLDPLIANAPKTDTPQEPVINVTKDNGVKTSIHYHD